MEENPETSTLRRAHRGPYLLGLALCVLWPALLELLLGRLPQGEPSSPDVIQSVGHTFTGIIFLAAAYIFWRKRRAKAALGEQDPSAHAASLRRETYMASILFAVCSLLGPLYFGMAGSPGMRHARSYIAAVPILFFAFAPRVSSWVPGPPARPREHAGRP